MAVVIWKDGNRELCTPQELPYQLGDGWSLTEHPESDEEDEAEAEQYIRDRAKELGIKSSHNKKLETLVNEIEALDDSNKG